MNILASAAVSFISPAHAHQKQDVFKVNPNIDIRNALNVSSDLLGSVMDLIADAAVGGIPLEGNNALMVAHTLESARAALNSVLGTMEMFDRLSPGE
jgi:hypothetical protein